MIDESTFLFRSWLNFLIVLLAVIRLRSGAWMLEVLQMAGSIVLFVLIVVGLVIYWLVRRWGTIA